MAVKRPKGTDVVYAELVKAAREMRTVTYEALAAAAKLAKPGVRVPLGYIRDEVCRPRGLPWLTVIAVSKTSGRPGEAYLPDDLANIMDQEDQRMWWRAMVLQVFATPWHEIKCEPPPADPN